MSKPPVLTIDGPSGAGKGTVSRLLAKQLGWHFLDSGAIYRALALLVLEQGVPPEDEEVIAKLAQTMKLEFRVNDSVQVLLGGRDVTTKLLTEQCGQLASKIAAYSRVRQALLEKQRAFRKPPGLVADGRDMGTVVFPDAPYKVFLTATLKERARRRLLQLQAKGLDVTLDQISKALEERDKRDQERKEAPLVPAPDAVVIDSTELSVEQVVARIRTLLPDSERRCCQG